MKGRVGMDKKRFETSVIHHGYDSKEMMRSLAVPIFQTSTYEFESAEQGEKAFLGEDDSYIYTRLGNPTVDILEKRIARLEGAERALAFSSGMAAISASLIALTKANDHIVSSIGLYGSTYRLLMMMKEKYNLSIDFSSLSTEEDIRQAIRPETACIYIETPINPTMQLVDLTLVTKVANTYNVPVIVDNTFATPYLQRPIEHGCDIVVHSATKYLNGHGDIVAGLVAGHAHWLEIIEKTVQRDVGAVLAPFNAWLLLRGMKTLALRMDRHCDNAEKIVNKLKQQSKVKAVFYPNIIKKNSLKNQMSRGGGMIAFEIDGDKATVQQFLNRLAFIKVAVSLGDAETLIEHPASMTHAMIPKEKRLEMGISETLIRLSVGLEAWEDIWQDIDQALNNE